MPRVATKKPKAKPAAETPPGVEPIEAMLPPVPEPAAPAGTR